MKKSILYSLLFLICLHTGLQAQNGPDLADYSMNIDDLNDPEFVKLVKSKLTKSQFVFIGEQHGIKEAAMATNAFYNIGQEFGYNTLCIETDDLAAKRIQTMASSGNLIPQFRKLHNEFPYSIPFYNNEDDQALFANVSAKKGDFWGIDQTFMMQFRLNFVALAEKASSKKLKNKLKELRTQADAAYDKAIANKDFKAPYIFKYDEVTHKELLSLAKTDEERKVIKELWTTKVIYEHNFAKRYYQNNFVRSELMKKNFMQLYRNAEKKEKHPKVILKLGAYHAAKGLTPTNIYDIASLGHELAISNGKRSVHVAVLGITGEAAMGNPFVPSPVAPFDNTKQLSEELKKALEGNTKKYFVIDLEPLRDFGYGKTFSDEFKKHLFAYDLLILVNDAEAVKSF